MKQMELKEWGLSTLDSAEMAGIDGGSWFSKIVKGITGIWLMEKIVDNWDEIKQGFSDGWNFDKARK